MNEQLVLLAIGVVVAVIVLRPLLRGRPRDAGRPPVQATAPLTMSDELAELELDRSMGRVSEEDYARWREELDAGVPANTGGVRSGSDSNLPHPRPAINVRHGRFESDLDLQDQHPDDAHARAEALVRQWRERPRPDCPNCGERPEPQARFCSRCGTALAG